MAGINTAFDPQQPPADFAEKYQADVGVEHVAGVYAEAFFGAAQNAGKTADLLAEFGEFLGDVLDHFPRLEQVLASALVSYEEKNRMLDRALSGRASPEFLRFLKVVSRHGRLDILRAIHSETGKLYDRKLGRIRVRVTTAVPIDDEAAGRIARNLRPLLAGEPVLEIRVDPAVIGGIVVRVEDTVYDGSIANQLEKLREQMVARSAHEIQSRRDRFRYPAGN